MKTLLFVLLTSIIMLGCEKKNDLFNIDTAVNIIYQDTVGNDLLDTTSANYYIVDNMRLFYLIDGEKIEYYTSFQDNSRNIMLIDYDGSLRDTLILRIFPYEGENTENGVYQTTTFLQLCDTETDTIRCEIKKTDNSVVCSKVWYNGILKWDSGLRLFTIIK